MTPLSTPEVARKVGIHPITLEKWIRAGKVRPSKKVQVGGKAFRIWTDRDVERVRRYKVAHYRKGRGRKKKKA